jgi:hypothetical protein
LSAAFLLGGRLNWLLILHTGTVLPPKAPYDARAAALAAGIPETVPLQIVNRYAKSSLVARQPFETLLSTPVY